MKFIASDLYRAAMIADRAKIEYIENGEPREAIVEIMGIDTAHLFFRRTQSAARQEIALSDIQSIERLGLSSKNMSERVNAFLSEKRFVMRDKTYRMSLWRRFGGKLQILKERVRMCAGCEALQAFLESNSALAGDIKRHQMDEIRDQLDQIHSGLEEELFRFAEALIALARRDITGAMKAYLAGVDDRPDANFIRKYAAQLAVASIELDGRVKNNCAFVYWIDQLLAVDLGQAIHDEAIWLNYLSLCVVFQHFKPLCEALRGLEDTKAAFEALAFVMASNEQPIQACQALDVLENKYGANYTVGQLLFQLIDDEHSYCVRYANRVHCLFEEKQIGQENVGYIYDYVKLRRFAHIVNGYLVSYFVNVSDINGNLLEYMDNCLKQGLDYEPDMVHFDRQEGGVATNVER